MNVSAADLYHVHPFVSICTVWRSQVDLRLKWKNPKNLLRPYFIQFALLCIPRDRRQFLSRRPGRTTPGNPASRTRAGVGKMKAGHSDMHLGLEASYHCQCNLTPKKQTGESLWMWTRLDRGFSFMKPNMTNVYENHGCPALWIPHLLMSPGERWWMSHQHRFPKGILSVKINAAGSKQKSGIIPGYWSAVMPECIALWKSCGYVY